MLRDRAALDPAADASARHVAAGVLLGAVRPPTDGAQQFDLSFRWFVGFGANEPVWDASNFSRNRDRLLEGILRRGFGRVDVTASGEATTLVKHFSVDGTMIQAWSSMKRVRPMRQDDDAPPPSSLRSGRDAEADFHGTTSTNATHASTTDPEARLYRKSAGAGAALALVTR